VAIDSTNERRRDLSLTTLEIGLLIAEADDIGLGEEQALMVAVRSWPSISFLLFKPFPLSRFFVVYERIIAFQITRCDDCVVYLHVECVNRIEVGMDHSSSRPARCIRRFVGPYTDPGPCDCFISRS
jgi:hypothetical protein